MDDVRQSREEPQARWGSSAEAPKPDKLSRAELDRIAALAARLNGKPKRPAEKRVIEGVGFGWSYRIRL